MVFFTDFSVVDSPRVTFQREQEPVTAKLAPPRNQGDSNRRRDGLGVVDVRAVAAVAGDAVVDVDDRRATRVAESRHDDDDDGGDEDRHQERHRDVRDELSTGDESRRSHVTLFFTKSWRHICVNFVTLYLSPLMTQLLFQLRRSGCCRKWIRTHDFCLTAPDQ